MNHVGAVMRSRPLLARAAVTVRQADSGRRQAASSNHSHRPNRAVVAGGVRWRVDHNLSSVSLRCADGQHGRTHVNVGRLVRWISTNDGMVKEPAKKQKQEVTIEELSKLIDDDQVNLVDVREAYELRDKGAIPKAINIPLTQLKCTLQMESEKFEQRWGMPKPSKSCDCIVFYGQGNVRSIAALEIACKMGYKKARHYPGGYMEWDKMKNNP